MTRHTVRDAAAGAALLVLAAAALVLDAALLRAMTDQLHMNDFGKFYYSARAFLDGADMYGPNPATDLRFPEAPELQFLNMNPPHFHLLVVPLARLAPSQAVLLWMAVSLLALVLSMLLVSRELMIQWTPLRLLATVTGALAFAGTQSFFVTGQLSLLLTLALTMAWLRARHDRWLEAAAWIGICASVKPFLLVFAPFLLGTRRVRASVVMLAAAAACIAVGLAIFGASAYDSWLRAVGQSGDWAWTVMNASVFGFFRRAFDAQPIAAPVFTAPRLVSVWPIVAAFVGLSTLAIAIRDRTNAAIDRAFALLLVAAQLISPLGWIYYMWLPIGPMAAMIFRRMPERGALEPSIRAWTSRMLAAIACVGFAWPMPFLTAFQPHRWATASIASIYFWATLATWLWLVDDAVHFAGTPQQYNGGS
jgi:glycosyl transferase family 87